MRSRAALTLVEVVVAVGLLATGLMLILSLLPAGVLSMKQAENLHTATQFAQRLIEEAPVPTSLPSLESKLTYEANGTVFLATRSMADAPSPSPTGACYDITVQVTWEGCQQPVQLTLRKAKES